MVKESNIACDPITSIQALKGNIEITVINIHIRLANLDKPEQRIFVPKED